MTKALRHAFLVSCSYVWLVGSCRQYWSGTHLMVVWVVSEQQGCHFSANSCTGWAELSGYSGQPFLSVHQLFWGQLNPYLVYLEQRLIVAGRWCHSLDYRQQLGPTLITLRQSHAIGCTVLISEVCPMTECACQLHHSDTPSSDQFFLC